MKTEHVLILAAVAAAAYFFWRSRQSQAVPAGALPPQTPAGTTNVTNVTNQAGTNRYDVQAAAIGAAASVAGDAIDAYNW